MKGINIIAEMKKNNFRILQGGFMITSNAQLDFIAGWSDSDEVSRRDLSFAFPLRAVAGSAWWASEIWGLSAGAISQLYAPQTLMSNELITERGRKRLPVRSNPNMQRNKMLFPASCLSDVGFLYGIIPWSENNGRFGGLFFPCVTDFFSAMQKSQIIE